MKSILVLISFTFSQSIIADTCREIEKYDELNSRIYVVCPNLPNVAKTQGNEIIKSIFEARKFVPDEYEVYFVKALYTNKEKSIKGNNLVGWYYTHSHQLTIWPNDNTKKKVISLAYE